MSTFHLFGIPITLDFGVSLSREEIDAKRARYEELTQIVDGNDEAEIDEVWTRQMHEQVNLFYELVDAGAIDPSLYEDEEEKRTQDGTPGVLGQLASWLFG